MHAFDVRSDDGIADEATIIAAPNGQVQRTSIRRTLIHASLNVRLRWTASRRLVTELTR